MIPRFDTRSDCPIPCGSASSSVQDDDLEEIERAISRTGTDILEETTLDEYSADPRMVFVAGMNQGYGSIEPVETGSIVDGHGG